MIWMMSPNFNDRLLIQVIYVALLDNQWQEVDISVGWHISHEDTSQN